MNHHYLVFYSFENCLMFYIILKWKYFLHTVLILPELGYVNVPDHPSNGIHTQNHPKELI